MPGNEMGDAHSKSRHRRGPNDSKVSTKNIQNEKCSNGSANATIFGMARRNVKAIQWVVCITITVALYLYWQIDNALGRSNWSPSSMFVDWSSRREEVRQVFIESWEAYSKHAWGKDTFHPISKVGGYMSPKGLGWVIIDSLDTMMIMNLTGPVDDATKWVQNDLTWDQDQDVNTFETTIRMLGGLLSAHFLSKQLGKPAQELYLSKAIDLADRLMVAYESGSGVPYASVNIGTRQGIKSHADGGASSTAEATTVQLEMKYLAHLTGNKKYWRVAERVMEVVDSQAMEGGLLPIFIHPEVGKFTTSEIRLGSRGDSYYEYLIKQYLQTGEWIYLDMWQEALLGMQTHLITTTRDAALKFVAELPSGVGQPLSPKMDHLVCFLPGTIAMGATKGQKLAEARRGSDWTIDQEMDIVLAKDLTKTCWGMYAVTETGLAPEIAWFNGHEADMQPRPGSRILRWASNALSKWKNDFIIKPLDAHNLQRPETVETLFMMYRITGESIYREWGWQIFQSFRKHMKVDDLGIGGYTSLNDVRTSPASKRDNMESFWMAETLKYLYLLFSPDDYLPLTDVVFNTEAHPFPRFTPGKGFQTGWTRRRD